MSSSQLDRIEEPAPMNSEVPAPMDAEGPAPADTEGPVPMARDVPKQDKAVEPARTTGPKSRKKDARARTATPKPATPGRSDRPKRAEARDEMIATLSLTCAGRSGRRQPISFEVGKPHSTGAEFRCSVHRRGLREHVSHFRADDTFQALVLAIAFVRTFLQALGKKGYRFFTLDGEECDPDRVWFSAFMSKEEKESLWASLGVAGSPRAPGGNPPASGAA
jgi:hypothetical protein